jgi:hypothetical protein
VAVEEAGRKVTVEDIRKRLHILKNWKELVKVIETYQEIGVNEVAIDTFCDKQMIRKVADNVLRVF